LFLGRCPRTSDTAASVRKLVAFYVDQHNSHLPHSAFKDQTPDEMYFGTGDNIPKNLDAAVLFTTTFGTFGREYSPLGSQLVITMPRRQLAY
jgi:hypothetical protein